MKPRIYLLTIIGLLAGLHQADAQVSFASAVTNAVSYAPTCVVAADVNNDGKLDLIVANSDIYSGTHGSGNTLTVLTNNGSGGFEFNAALQVGTNPVCVAAADVNGDGKVDLFSANYRDNTLTVLTNNGSGGFGLSATLPVGNPANNVEGQSGGYPRWVTAADLNGDGKMDLISANFNNNTLTVYTNNGSGAFGLNATLSETGWPDFVLAADVNGDGKLDLIGVNSLSPPIGNTLSIFTNNGSGVFGSNATVYAGPNPACVVPVDINGRGKPDLIVANDNPNWLTVLTNNGSGVFGSNATITVESFANFVTAADLNGDGKADLIVAGSDGTLEVLTNNGQGGFGSNATINAGYSPRCVAAADVNGDGRPDLISVNTVGVNDDVGMLMVFLNTSAFPPPASTPPVTLNPFSNGMRVSWPSASAGWSLQQSPDLTAAHWGPGGYSGYTISDDSTKKSLVIPSQPGNLFFRLLHP
jgi:hypothetical protein